MTAKDLIDISLKFADFGAKAVQFHILILIGVSGWLVSSGVLTNYEPLHTVRFMWAFVYLMPTFTFVYVYNLAAQRSNASMKLAGMLMDLPAKEAIVAREITKIISPIFANIVVILVTVIIIAIVLLFYMPVN